VIGLALAIAGAWFLLEFGGALLGLLLAAFGRWKDQRDMLRALRWWASLTTDEQALWLERMGHVSEANVLRAWDAHRAELPL
jgi:hypothetical protein